MGPRHPLPFLPMAHPMALKCPAWGWSSSFHQRCRKIFCSSCWRRQTPALQSLSWQLCIPRTAKRIWCQGGRYWWWCLSFMFYVYIFKLKVPNIWSSMDHYIWCINLLWASRIIFSSAPKQRDTTNARCVAKCGRRSWSSGTCVQCKSSRLIPMGTNIIGETAGWGVKIFRVDDFRTWQWFFVKSSYLLHSSSKKRRAMNDLSGGPWNTPPMHAIAWLKNSPALMIVMIPGQCLGLEDLNLEAWLPWLAGAVGLLKGYLESMSVL